MSEDFEPEGLQGSFPRQVSGRAIKVDPDAHYIVQFTGDDITDMDVIRIREQLQQLGFKHVVAFGTGDRIGLKVYDVSPRRGRRLKVTI